MRILLLLSIIWLVGCQNESPFQEAQLLGDWQAISWIDKTNNRDIDAKVSFKFEEQNRYSANSGNSTEKGKFWISGDNLHTHEDGKAEKKVKIEKLNQDTLIFGMNRAGNLEVLTLIRVK